MAENGKQALTLPGLLLVTTLVGACTYPTDNTSGFARHYRFSDELQAIMWHMERLVHNRQLTGTEVDSLRVTAKSSRCLPASLPKKPAIS